MKELFEMLQKEAEADKSKAILSLNLLANHPSGIGDHSTKDFWENARHSLDLFCSAEERLHSIKELRKIILNEGESNN